MERAEPLPRRSPRQTRTPGAAAPVTSVAALRDKLVSGAADGAVRLWDATTGLALRCDGIGSAHVAGTALGENYMLSAAWDGVLRCWAPPPA